MGGIKKMQFEHISGLLKCPKLCASNVENPGAILTFLCELDISSVMDFPPTVLFGFFIIKGILWSHWQTLFAIEMQNCLQVQY